VQSVESHSTLFDAAYKAIIVITMDTKESTLFHSRDKGHHHRVTEGEAMNLDDRREEGGDDDGGESLQSRPTPSTSESMSSTSPLLSCPSRIQTTELFQISADSIPTIPHVTRTHHLLRTDGQQRGAEDEIAALNLKIRTMELEHKAELSTYKDALVMTVTDLGKMDIIRSMTLSNLQNTDHILESRQCQEQLKAQLLVLREENLNLAGRLERAMIQISSLDTARKIAEEVEDENKKLRIQLRQYENLMTKACNKTKLSGAVAANTTRPYSRPRSSTPKRF
jgi:hypothetical protein